MMKKRLTWRRGRMSRTSKSLSWRWSKIKLISLKERMRINKMTVFHSKSWTTRRRSTSNRPFLKESARSSHLSPCQISPRSNFLKRQSKVIVTRTCTSSQWHMTWELLWSLLLAPMRICFHLTQMIPCSWTFWSFLIHLASISSP